MKMSEIINNKLLAQISFAFLLLATIISKHLNCEALVLKQNRANSFPILGSYQKANTNEAVPQIDTKSPSVVAPSILSDYYNSILTNSGQNLRRIPQSWPQPDFVPISNVVDNNEYETGDEYYSDDNSESLRSAPNDLFYANDVYQPEGWFNGPVVFDTPDTNIQTDESNDAQLNTLMMAYLLDQFDKLNKLKDLSEKRGFQQNSNTQEVVTTTAQPPVITTPTVRVTTNAIPKKLTAKQFRLFQRGQKEFPLLRPAVDNDDKTSDNSNSKWPTELEENNLSQEDSLMSLKQQKGQMRTVRDVLTAQLDDLKKEGPKMH
jgi:hypothetical protein